MIIGIIPARFASTRLMGKPLATIGDKPMIQHTYESAKKSKLIEKLILAVDDAKVASVARGFGADVIETPKEITSGSDRIAYVSKIYKEADIIANIQGDEPYIHPEQIDLAASCFNNPDVNIATLAIKLTSEEELFNPNIIRVVFDIHKKALYFSRNPIPFVRNFEKKDWSSQHQYFKHIGIYAYRPNTLQQITRLDTSPLEQAESLEQLRWLENGFKIHVEFTGFESIAVDTPEDLLKFLNKP